jgi:hypothetical protein
MKKRSNPIPLYSVAILCFVLIGYFGYRNSPSTPDAPQQQQPPTGDPVGKERPAPSKSDISSHIDIGTPQVASTAKPGMPPMPKQRFEKGGKYPLPPLHSPKPHRPMPNDSSISTQWYTDEANKTMPGN